MARRAALSPTRALVATTLVLALLGGTVACSSDSSGGTAGTTSRPARTTTTAAGTVTTTTEADDPTGSETAQDYAAAISRVYSRAGATTFGEAKATCVAPKVVAAVGVGRFRSAGITPAEVASGQKGLSDLHVSARQAGRIIDDMAGCGVILRDFVRAIYSAGATLTPAQRTCLDAAFPDAAVRAVLVAQLRGLRPAAALFRAAQRC